MLVSRFSYLYLFLGRKQNYLQVREKMGKSTLFILTIKKMPTLTGNKHISIHFFPAKAVPFSVIRRQIYGHNASEMDIIVLIPSPTQKFSVKTKRSKVFHNQKRLINSSD